MLSLFVPARRKVHLRHRRRQLPRIRPLGFPVFAALVLTPRPSHFQSHQQSVRSLWPVDALAARIPSWPSRTGFRSRLRSLFCGSSSGPAGHGWWRPRRRRNFSSYPASEVGTVASLLWPRGAPVRPSAANFRAAQLPEYVLRSRSFLGSCSARELDPRPRGGHLQVGVKNFRLCFWLKYFRYISVVHIFIYLFIMQSCSTEVIKKNRKN